MNDPFDHNDNQILDTVDSRPLREYVSLYELAKRHGYAKDHLGWLARAGKIDAVKASTGQWYAREASFQDYVAGVAERRLASFKLLFVPNPPVRQDAGATSASDSLDIVLSPVLFHNEDSSNTKRTSNTLSAVLGLVVLAS